MREYFDFGHPHIITYITTEALKAYERSLGRKNEINHKVIKEQLRQAREYMIAHPQKLIPRGVYSFRRKPHFVPTELEDISLTCELVFLLTQGSEDTKEAGQLLSIAYMDATREYLSKQFFPALYKASFGRPLLHVSPFFGPGLFYASMDQLENYYKYLKVDSDLATVEQSMLLPISTFIGAIYGLEKPMTTSICANCYGQSNCQLCMINQEQVNLSFTRGEGIC